MVDTTKGTPVVRLATLRQTQLDWLGDVATTLSMSGLRTGDADYWGYQTCTEFGFYQVCLNPFSE
jgi:hypothetical protein